MKMEKEEIRKIVHLLYELMKKNELTKFKDSLLKNLEKGRTWKAQNSQNSYFELYR